MRFLAEIAIFALVVSFSGCGPEAPERSPTAKVSGTVTLDGNPVKEGTIVFESPGSRQANGKIKDGQIVEVFTYEPGDGVPVGSHKVAVFVTGTESSAVVANPGEATPVDANYMGAGPSGIPTRYHDPQKSGLTAEVKDAPDNPLKFELSSK